MTGSLPNTMKKISFNDFAIDVDSSLLLKAGKKVPLGPRPFEVLLYLFENRGRVVGKQELFEKIWGTDFVTDAARFTAGAINSSRHSMTEPVSRIEACARFNLPW